MTKRLIDAAKAAVASGQYHISTSTPHGEYLKILLHAITDAERHSAHEWLSVTEAAKWPEGSVVVERQTYLDESLGDRTCMLHEYWRPDSRPAHTEWLTTQGVRSEFMLIAAPKGGES